MATARKPRASRAAERSSAAGASPTTSGTMALRARARPSRSERRAAARRTRAPRSGSAAITSRAARAAAAARAPGRWCRRRRGRGSAAGRPPPARRRRSRRCFPAPWRACHLERRAGAFALHHAQAVGVVGQGQASWRSRRPGCRHRREVAVHAEHTFGEHQRPPRPRAQGGETVLQVLRVIVREALHPRAGEPGARPQRGMAESVQQHEVARSDQRRDHAEVGRVAAGEHQRRLRRLGPRQGGLQGAGLGRIAGHQARAAGARAVSLQGGVGGGQHTRMVGEVEVVVAGERDHLACRPASTTRPAEAGPWASGRSASGPDAESWASFSGGEGVQAVGEARHRAADQPPPPPQVKRWVEPQGWTRALDRCPAKALRRPHGRDPPASPSGGPTPR